MSRILYDDYKCALAGGCEAAIHDMRTLYENEETDAVLLIDAANAFNSINRRTSNVEPAHKSSTNCAPDYPNEVNKMLQ